MNDNINNHFSIPKKKYIKGGEHEWVSVLLLPAMVTMENCVFVILLCKGLF
ncbi:protein of unknown function [Streptococcus thermophilus]|uniref:Uncharacterized protein n=1 Tax=Streptococcus thermophilus TaxID=1308 RepID=A0A8D6XQW1_STRTR|nr:protein of unknown function [Streptococcus thermophilus]